MDWSITTHGRLFSFSRPCVMGIINVSDDSFYRSFPDVSDAVEAAVRMVRQGAQIIDIGACSTRPGAEPVSAAREWERLYPAIQAIRQALPDMLLSVDTFRSVIARRALEEGADIINDVYGGEADAEMFPTMAHYRVPYVLTHGSRVSEPTADYDPAMSEVLAFLQNRVDALHRLGVPDVIIDPGFGFGKTIPQTYTILREMQVLEALQCPVLVGMSHKSMLCRPLHVSPEQALPATTAAHILALERGAAILRVHEVPEAIQAIDLYAMLKGENKESFPAEMG